MSQGGRHPHASGEHGIDHPKGAPCDGSSPREWGTPRTTAHAPLSIRFIPTRVGNTKTCCIGSGNLSVHPHASGEHFSSGTNNMRVSGSSPREWGTLRHPENDQRKARFIPTRVGNTRTLPPGRNKAAVHPPASGEHVMAFTANIGDDGSSPREWGTLCSAPFSPHANRFIPTRVGNTLLPS